MFRGAVRGGGGVVRGLVLICSIPFNDESAPPSSSRVFPSIGRPTPKTVLLLRDWLRRVEDGST